MWAGQKVKKDQYVNVFGWVKIAHTEKLCVVKRKRIALYKSSSFSISQIHFHHGMEINLHTDRCEMHLQLFAAETADFPWLWDCVNPPEKSTTQPSTVRHMNTGSLNPFKSNFCLNLNV